MCINLNFTIFDYKEIKRYCGINTITFYIISGVGNFPIIIDLLILYNY